MNIGDLKQRQSLPLEMKIQKSIRTIEDFYDKFDGDVYISRGGVDSAVLSWLAKQSGRKDIQNVCVASVEPPENIKFNLKSGATLLKSGGTMNVVKKYGYPLISKEVAMKISRYKNTKHEWVKEKRLKGELGRNGKWIYDSRIPLKYQFLIYAPFDFTEKCCDITKKKPLKKFEKETGKHPITGEMAEESLLRKKQYLKHGCIMIDKQRPKCTPLGFWTEQDIKQAILKYDIPYPKEIYGNIISGEDGKLHFDKEKRTGCTVCGFGMLFDTDRFERLKKRNRCQYDYMFGGGEWVRKDKYRYVKFRPNGILIWSNLYWVPNEKGYGYRYPVEYILQGLKIKAKI